MKFNDHIQKLNRWQEDLVRIREENASLKIRLSDLVDNSVMTDFLATAEKIHSELIANDESIELLLTSIASLRYDIESRDLTDSSYLAPKKKELFMAIRKFESRFSALAESMNTRLSFYN